MGEAIKKLFLIKKLVFIRRFKSREYKMVSQDPGLNNMEVLDWNAHPGLTFDGSFMDDSNGRYGTEGRYYWCYPDVRIGELKMHQNPDCSTASIHVFIAGYDKR